MATCRWCWLGWLQGSECGTSSRDLLSLCKYFDHMRWRMLNNVRTAPKAAAKGPNCCLTCQPRIHCCSSRLAQMRAWTSVAWHRAA